MPELNVNPADLERFANAYSELAQRTAQISPQAATEVQRVMQTHGPMGYPTALGIAAGLAKAEGPVQAKVADFNNYAQRFTEHSATYTKADQTGAQELDNHFQHVDDKHGWPDPPTPAPAIDPRNPFVGDERFGYWRDAVPPPYVGKNPPEPWTGHRPWDSGMAGGPSGFYVPGGKTWADDNAPPFADLQEQYKFRISGVDYTPYTRIDPSDGHRQQWVQYTYESQRFTQVNLGGPLWASKGPNEITGELGGTVTGGLAGINPPPHIGDWKPITLPQIASLSAANPTVQYYVPDGCGGQFNFVGGVPVGGLAPTPTIPSMIAAPAPR
ncbi:hypothetical protein BZL29_7699 [Mycobacterium kansasii]|uniref:Uncharacterized protein n=1 Tax=Mycobacterium kansasii TaxID=1768 RepID=A0A1V3WE85_MYCKA|nr:hypothetical protein BZL29_7699 [Mycobacterium kansasii]